ncbi:MAG: hypothetical protein H0U86_17130 [Chloroflexi bacterium]|nr:hypothetical protein [Chloroflexota bacterium]
MVNSSARWPIPWSAISVIVLAAIMAAAVGYVVSARLPKTYEARVQLVAGQVLDAVDPDYTQLLAWPLMAQMYAQLATARPVLETVIEDLGLSTNADGLRRRVRAETSQESVLLTLEVEDGDPQQASRSDPNLAKPLLNDDGRSIRTWSPSAPKSTGWWRPRSPSISCPS